MQILANSIGGSRAAATSKMERFVIIVNGWKPLTFMTKRSILDVAAALDPRLNCRFFFALAKSTFWRAYFFKLK